MKLLKFYADFCNPCKVVTKRLKEANLPIEIKEIDAEENMELCSSYEVGSVPTCILVDGTKEVKRWNGIFNIDELKEIIKTEKI